MNRTTPGGVATDTWCAGGRQQIAPIAVGSAPPEIRKLLAEFGRNLTSGRLAEETRRAVKVATQKPAHQDQP